MGGWSRPRAFQVAMGPTESKKAPKAPLRATQHQFHGKYLFLDLMPPKYTIFLLFMIQETISQQPDIRFDRDFLLSASFLMLSAMTALKTPQFICFMFTLYIPTFLHINNHIRTSRGKSRGWDWSKQPVKCELCGKEGIEGDIERDHHVLCQAWIMEGEVAYIVLAVVKTQEHLHSSYFDCGTPQHFSQLWLQLEASNSTENCCCCFVLSTTIKTIERPA